MNDQITSHILMIRPINFRYNVETATNNYYQKVIDGLDDKSAQIKALEEFETIVRTLRYEGIDVTVISDTMEFDTPDSIFPNNWVSFHENGTVATYPMFAKNRQNERNPKIIEEIGEKFNISNFEDFSEHESEDKFLEGTGSMILDRQNKIVYAAISPRTHQSLLDEFSQKFGYKVVSFIANQTINGSRERIYHTNVLMALAETFCVICLESIDNEIEKFNVIESLQNTNKEIIDITEDQMNSFAGNMLQIKNNKEKRFAVMSTAAFEAFSKSQKSIIEVSSSIIHSSLDTIEACGGGSARCMMAEIFLSPKNER